MQQSIFNNPLLSPPDEENPYSLENIPQEKVYWVKASLKWEDGNWTAQEILMLKKKLMYCYIRKEIHWDLAYQYNKLAKYVDIPKIILSSVLSTSLFVNATDEEAFSSSMQYINAVMSTSLAVIVGLDSYVKFGDKHIGHRSSSLDYGKLASDIERYIQSPTDERDTFINTLSEIDDRYGKIKHDAPFVSQSQLKKYIELFNNNNDYNDRINIKYRTRINSCIEQDENELKYVEDEEKDKKTKKKQQNEREEDSITDISNQSISNYNAINTNDDEDDNQDNNTTITNKSEC